MRTRRGQTLVTAAVLAFAGLFCVLALPLSSSAGRFPLAAGVLTMILGSLQLIADLRLPVESAFGTGGEQVRESPVILWVAALVAGVYLTGLSFALPVFAGLYWRLRDGAGWTAAIGAGVCVFVFVQGILGWLLRIDLYDGVIRVWLGV